MRLRQEEIEYAIGRLEICKNSRGLSQTDLGALTGVEQSTISKILKRQQEPSIEILQKLFEGLGLAASQCGRRANGYSNQLLGFGDPGRSNRIGKGARMPTRRPACARKNLPLFAPAN